MNDIVVSFRVSLIFEDAKKAKEYFIESGWGDYFIPVKNLLDLKEKLAPEMFHKTYNTPVNFYIDGLGLFEHVKGTNSWELYDEKFGKVTFISSTDEPYEVEMEWL